ncbi:DUF222 domain-containing protein, partial [Arthrobacter sp.]|uniref:DUF222 domain-containing protein n=1 Tax=Arthrobacter sp. TaxID=1667 RepID=UPI002810F2C0
MGPGNDGPRVCGGCRVYRVFRDFRICRICCACWPLRSGPGSAWSGGDGCRNTAEFLRARLRISAAEARRRLALAAALLPSTGITGQPVPPAREEPATAYAAGTIPSRAATIITLAL